MEVDLPSSCQEAHDLSIFPWFLVFILTGRSTVFCGMAPENRNLFDVEHQMIYFYFFTLEYRAFIKVPCVVQVMKLE